MPVATKLLLGWMEETEALAWLVREYRGDPPHTEQTARDLWNQYRERVAALSQRDCLPPKCIQERTRKEEYAEHHFMQKFRKEPRVIRVLKLDDPSKLIVHQLSVVVPQSEKYLAQMRDPNQRIRLALGRGLAFDGKRPQARRDGTRLIKPVPHAEFLVTQGNQYDFELREGYRHISVKEFDNRLMLASGYHRTHISIYRTSPEDMVLPLFAVLESDTVDGFFSTGSKVPFKRDMVRGACPPLLGDFFDSSLCIEVPTRKCRVEIFVDLQTQVWDRLWVDDEP